MTSDFASITGVIAPNLTPFNDDLSIATDLYIEHALDLLDQGCAALAPFGTTGEALSISSSERIDMLTALVEAGANPSQLIPGTGLTNLPETVALSRACLDLGCAAVVVLPPFYFKGVPCDGLVGYFAELITRINHPDSRIVLYHIPQVAGVGLPIDVVRTLKQAFPDQIVGIKDSSGDADNLRALFEIEGLMVYPGSELMLPVALPLGGPGCITASANFNASAIQKAITSAKQPEESGFDAHFESVKAARLALQTHPAIPALKAITAKRTGNRNWLNVRPPLVRLDQDAQAALFAELPTLHTR